jgi:large subunit ribosomal protein L11
MAEKISDMIKKEAGVEKGAGAKDAVGDIPLEKLIGIAKKKKAGSLGKTLKDALKEAAGTCKSMGITIGGKDPRTVIREIDDGKHDSLVAGK